MSKKLKVSLSLLGILIGSFVGIYGSYQLAVLSKERAKERYEMERSVHGVRFNVLDDTAIYINGKKMSSKSLYLSTRNSYHVQIEVDGKIVHENRFYTPKEHECYYPGFSNWVDKYEHIIIVELTKTVDPEDLPSLLSPFEIKNPKMLFQRKHIYEITVVHSWSFNDLAPILKMNPLVVEAELNKTITIR